MSLKKTFYYYCCAATLSIALCKPSAIAASEFNIGMSHVNLGNYQQALESYTKYINEDPSHGFAFFQRAGVFEKLNLKEKSIEDLSKYLEYSELHPDPDTDLSDSALDKRGDLYCEIGDFAKAKEDFSKLALQPEPGSMTLFKLGVVNLKLGLFEEALSHFSKAIDMKPTEADYYRGRSFAYSQLGRKDNAEVDLQKYNELKQKQAATTETNSEEDSELQVAIDESNLSNKIRAYEQLGQYESAILECGKYIQLKPTDSERYTRRAEIYREAGQVNKAIDDFNKAVSLMPDDPKIYIERGDFFEKIKQPQKKLQDYNAAISLYTQKIQKSPSDASLYDGRAGLYARLEENQKAVADYTKAISLGPGESLSYYGRARCYDALKQYPQAIADYSKAIETNSYIAKDTSAYYCRGEARMKLEQFDDAVKDFTKVIEIAPGSTYAIEKRAECYLALDKAKDALLDHNKLVELSPKDSRAFAARANVYGELNDKKRAVTDFSKAISLNPKYQWAYYRRGLLRESTEPLKAIEDYTASINLDPKDDRAYFMRGKVYVRLGQNSKADADFNKVISLSPKGKWSADVYSLKARAYEKAGQYQKALGELDNGQQITPNDRGFRLRKIEIYRKLGQHQQALAELDKALKTDPNDRGWLLTKSRVFRDLGQHDKGIECLEKTLGPSENDKCVAAIVYFDEAIKLNPRSAWTYAGRGRVYFEKLRFFDKAIEDCTLAIALDPKCANAYLYRGLAYRKQKQQEKALADFKQAISLDQKLAEKIALSN